MASGLPLIVLDNRGTRDFARNGENAIVCYRSDPAEFARAIGTLAADPERCREMGRINADKAWRYDVGLVEQVMRRVYAGEAAEEAGTSEAVPGR
jgi:glycosyltransferase EpsD